MTKPIIKISNYMLGVILIPLATAFSDSLPKVYKYQLFSTSNKQEYNRVVKVISGQNRILELLIVMPKAIDPAGILDSTTIDSISKYIEDTPFLEAGWCERLFDLRSLPSFEAKSFLAIESMSLLQQVNSIKTSSHSGLLASGYSSPWEKFILDSLNLKNIRVNQSDSVLIGYDSLNIVATKIIAINQFGFFVEIHKGNLPSSAFLLSYEDMNRIATTGFFKTIGASSLSSQQVEKYKKWESDIIAENCNDF